MTQQVTPPTPMEEQELPRYGLRRKKKALKRLAYIGLLLLIACFIGIGVFVYNLGKPTTTNTMPTIIGYVPGVCANANELDVIVWNMKSDSAYEFVPDQIPACPNAQTGCMLDIHGANLLLGMRINQDSAPYLSQLWNIVQLKSSNPGFDPNKPFSGSVTLSYWQQNDPLAAYAADLEAQRSDHWCVTIPGEIQMAAMGFEKKSFSNEADFSAQAAQSGAPQTASLADLTTKANESSLLMNCTNMLPSGSVVDEKRAELVAACQTKFAGVEVTKQTLLDMQALYADLIAGEINSIFEETSATSIPTIVVPTPTLIPLSDPYEWNQITTFAFDQAFGYNQSTNGLGGYQVTVNGHTLFVSNAVFCINNSSCNTMEPGQSYQGTGKIEHFPSFSDASGNPQPEYNVLTVWKTRTEGLQNYLDVMPIPGRQLHQLEYWFFSVNAASGVVNQDDLATIGLTVMSDESCGYQGFRATDAQGVTACVSNDPPGLCDQPAVKALVAAGVATCKPSGGSAWPYLTVCRNGVDINSSIDSAACWSVRWDTYQ